MARRHDRDTSIPDPAPGRSLRRLTVTLDLEDYERLLLIMERNPDIRTLSGAVRYAARAGAEKISRKS